MRIGIRFKQIAAVTVIVGVAVIALSGLHVRRLASVVLTESHARGEMLANAVFHRVQAIVPGSADPYEALRGDSGLRSILEASIFGASVTRAAIVDPGGTVVVGSDPALVGRTIQPGADLAALVEADALEQLRVIYSREGETLEVRQPMTLGDEAFGTIRVGLSTLLMRQELSNSLRPAVVTAVVALAVAVLVAALLAQLLLRPIHVIRSGLTRLGQGEFGVTLDLPQRDEFGDLGKFFNELSQQLSVSRDAAPKDQQQLLQSTIAYSRKLMALSRLNAGIAHEVKNPLNAMMIHLELLRTKIRSGAVAAQPQTVGAAERGGLGLAEAAHGAPKTGQAEGVLQHVQIIESEIRRLDEVVQGFLKFTRPEDLRLQPVAVPWLFEEILPVIRPEADKHQVRVVVDAPPGVPEAHGDASMLRQAFLNLAINACQAMPQGGTLRLVCVPAPHGRVEVRVEDTGVGIPPEHLEKIFDLYFTTKDHGTGIGLSMVYRIVQMHDGEIEVQSTPGGGTTFRILLPRAGEQ